MREKKSKMKPRTSSSGQLGGIQAVYLHTCKSAIIVIWLSFFSFMMLDKMEWALKEDFITDKRFICLFLGLDDVSEPIVGRLRPFHDVSTYSGVRLCRLIVIFSFYIQ